jgi:hypothetical protein
VLAHALSPAFPTVSRLFTLTAQIAASDRRAHIYALGNPPYHQRLQSPGQSSQVIDSATDSDVDSSSVRFALGTFQRLLELDFLDPPRSGLMVALEPETGSEAWKGGEVAEEVDVGLVEENKKGSKISVLSRSTNVVGEGTKGPSGTKEYQKATEGVEASNLKLKRRRRHIRCRVAAETGGITFAVP